MFPTDARELGAREVAPDAVLFKLPKKKRKVKKIKQIRKKKPATRKKERRAVAGRQWPVTPQGKIVLASIFPLDSGTRFWLESWHGTRFFLSRGEFKILAQKRSFCPSP